MQPRQNKDQKLICIDIDHTLIDPHHHNILIDAIREARGNAIGTAEERFAELKKAGMKGTFMEWRVSMSEFKQNPDSPEHQFRYLQACGIGILGDAKKWRDAITSLVESGHQVALTSFTAFKLAPHFLTELLGLPNEIANKIHIETWLPENPNQANKNLHIQKAIDATVGEIKPQNVILIDDSIRNINAANDEKHYKTIVALHDGTHVNELSSLTNDIKRTMTNTSTAPTANVTDATNSDLIQKRSFIIQAPSNKNYDAFSKNPGPDPLVGILKDIQSITANKDYWKTKVRTFGIPDGVKAIDKFIAQMDFEKMSSQELKETLDTVKKMAQKHQLHGGGSDPLFHRHKDTDAFYTAIRKQDARSIESLVDKMAEQEFTRGRKPK